MKYLFYTLIIFLAFSNISRANFDLISTLGIGYDNSEVEVEYEKNRNLGLSTTEINNLNIDNLIYWQNGGVLRKKGYGDRVFVVPGSIVNFNLIAKNNSTEIINIFGIRNYISRTNLNNGDLSRFELIPTGIENGRNYLDTINQITLNPQASINKQVLTFQIPDKLSVKRIVTDIKYSVEGATVESNNIIKNQSSYSLCNLVFQDINAEIPFCILPNEQLNFKILDKFSHPVPEKIIVGGFNIVDNNTHFESITTQAINPFDTTFDTLVFKLNTSVGNISSILQSENNLTVVEIPYLKKYSGLEIILQKDISVTLLQNLFKLEKSNSGVLELELLNTGNHIYNDIIEVKDSANFKFSGYKFEIQDLLNQQKTKLSIPFEVKTRKNGEYVERLEILFGDKSYFVDLKYRIQGKKFEVL